MPYLDFNLATPPFQGDEFDVTVVGAGAAGIMLALELTRRGRKVLLVESGCFGENEKRQAYNDVEQTGKFLANAVWGRKRAVGGTTIAWGGQSLPFRELDFEGREWVQNSGWPIPYDTVAKHYRAANDFMKIDRLDYREEIFKLCSIKDPGFSKDLIDFHFSKWAPEPDFTKVHGKELDLNVPVIFNALLTSIDTDGNGRVTGICIQNYSGSSHSLKVNRMVIAAGGIETVRTLLANRQPDGIEIGNHSGWLGKCFMDHPCIEAGIVKPADGYGFQRLFSSSLRNGRKYSKRLSLSAEAQRSRGLLNASAMIMFSYPEESFDPYLEIRNMRNWKLPNLPQLLSSLPSYSMSLRAYLQHNFFYKHGAQAKLVMMLEQEPTRESWIGLSESRDPHGIPRAKVHWDVTRRTWDSVIALSDICRVELSRLGLGEYEPYAHVKQDFEEWKEALSDVCHHMGGARMSKTPENGVVDTELNVWGYSNLRILSSSVFPTVSHSNPTLTLLALGQRLAQDRAWV
jgi:choline dehydrogenase-like flavoprotein